jgi:hypothetical protein
MILGPLQPFTEAIKSVADKNVLPTSMSSAELQQLGGEFHRANFTSARTLLADLLDQYKADVQDIINPTVEQRADRVTEANPQGNVNVGLSQAEARLKAKQLLDELSYSPNPDEAGTIKDLSSDARINLVLETNRDIAQGFGWFLQGQDQAVLDAFPAQELLRIEDRKEPRDWPTRWSLCAAVVGDVDAARVLAETGRMIALKDSDIWQALGDGEDGSTDTLGNPFPPFAFLSGMGVRDIGYTEAVALGVIDPGQKVEPQKLDYPQPPSDAKAMEGRPSDANN